MIHTQKPKQLPHVRPINHTPQGAGHPIKDSKFFRRPPPPKKRKPRKK